MLNIGKILTFVSKKHQKWSKSHEFLMFFNKYALYFSIKWYLAPPSICVTLYFNHPCIHASHPCQSSMLVMTPYPSMIVHEKKTHQTIPNQISSL